MKRGKILLWFTWLATDSFFRLLYATQPVPYSDTEIYTVVYFMVGLQELVASQ